MMNDLIKTLFNENYLAYQIVFSNITSTFANNITNIMNLSNFELLNFSTLIIISYFFYLLKSADFYTSYILICNCYIYFE